jgi:hypothetical protein
MKRRHFLALFGGAIADLPAIWPWAARGQSQPPNQASPDQPPSNQAPSDQAPANQAPSNQTPSPAAADNSIGQVATLAGMATVIRANAAPAALKVADPLYEQDTLQTNVNSTLGITFDDQTTFSLSANTRIVIDQFVYQEGGSGNAASLNVAVGTAAFVASLVAKTGDMKITTPQATLGIRGTTGIVDVPQGTGAAAPTVKLYPDSDGHVGSIDVFDRQGARLGALTQGSSAFIVRAGAGGRIAVVPYQIPAQEAARDRGVLQRLSLSHTIGRQMIIRRQQLRTPNNQRPRGPQPNNQRRPGGQQPGGQQPNRPGGQQPNNQRPTGPQPNNQRPGGQQPNNQRPIGSQPNNQRPGGLQPNNQHPSGPQPNRPGGQQPLNRLQRGQPRQRPRRENNQ